MKKAARSRLMDKLHKGFVVSCITVSLIGSAFIGYSYINYIMNIRPEFRKQQLLAEQELLKEGKPTEDSAALLAS